MNFIPSLAVQTKRTLNKTGSNLSVIFHFVDFMFLKQVFTVCLHFCSLRSKKSDSDGSEWAGWSVRESKTCTRIKRQSKTKDKDGTVPAVPSVEWNVFIV